MNYDELFVHAAGRTPRGQYVGAVIALLAAFAFYFFLVPGRNGQWVQLVFIYPAVVLHARRLHDMGRTAWLLVVPAGLILASAWLHLFVPGSAAQRFVTPAAVVVSALFVIWGLIGKSADPNRSAAPAA